MKFVLIHNLARPALKPVLARNCASFFCRLRGLTFRRALPGGQALLLAQKKDSRLDASIHMLAVFMELAVVWIDTNKFVVDSCLARPWHPYYAPKSAARYVLEMEAARLDDFLVGEQVSFEEVLVD